MYRYFRLCSSVLSQPNSVGSLNLSNLSAGPKPSFPFVSGKFSSFPPVSSFGNLPRASFSSSGRFSSFPRGPHFLQGSNFLQGPHLPQAPLSSLNPNLPQAPFSSLNPNFIGKTNNVSQWNLGNRSRLLPVLGERYHGYSPNYRNYPWLEKFKPKPMSPDESMVIIKLSPLLFVPLSVLGAKYFGLGFEETLFVAIFIGIPGIVYFAFLCMAIVISPVVGFFLFMNTMMYYLCDIFFE